VVVVVLSDDEAIEGVCVDSVVLFTVGCEADAASCVTCKAVTGLDGSPLLAFTKMMTAATTAQPVMSRTLYFFFIKLTPYIDRL
jgi:hypothetical protein